MVRLYPEPDRLRKCACGKSLGFYLNDRMAYFQGPCVPLGVDNNSLAQAIREINTPLTPYERLDIKMFRFRSDSKYIKFDESQGARIRKEVDRWIEMFQDPAKIK